MSETAILQEQLTLDQPSNNDWMYSEERKRLKNDSGIFVYTTPDSDNVKVNISNNIQLFGDEVACVINLSGNTVKIGKVSGHTFEMNLSALESGPYMLRIELQEGYMTSKLVKQ